MQLPALPTALALLVMSCLAPATPAPQTAAPEPAPSAFDGARFEGWRWREVGPYRGGRVAAVCGVPSQPDVYWMGACGGGVWKTTDAGRTWRNVSDGTFGGSIGAVAVAESDPNVVYVGGGEKTVRGNVSHGDGIWRSTDAGRTWTFAGLPDSRHVARIRVHPTDPDTAWAAVLGHLFGPNEERGVYRTTDGGATWERVLFVDAAVGAVDLALDPTNPRILYTTFWRVKRTPYSLESGGEGSGLWKSADGGDTWTELTGNPGLPDAPIGICGVAVSRSNPDNVYAIVEAEEGGVFRSRDAGETWTRTNESRELRQRAWYYSRLVADPTDEDVVYVLNVRFHRSRDGGKTFETIAVPHGDNHDLWIAPDDPRRMIQSNDGGANVSTDGGATWTRQDNQPTAQMYRVSTDAAFPYRLLGGQQDNSAVRIRSRSFGSGRIDVRDWEPTAGGESGHVAAKPDDPEVVLGGSYGGYLALVNHRTGERRTVSVWPDNPMGWGAGDLRYRFQWNFPLFFSPHDPDLVYAAANVLFRSRDLGASWEAISPDLTRADPATLGPSGGPITKDNTGVEYYATIFAACESPLRAGVLWCGSDDGRVHVSRDAGASWTDVTPPDMPEWTQVNCLEPHPTEPGGAYLAGTRYKLDDFRPYLWRTADWGATWRRIDAGIPADHFTRALRADPVRPGLLFAGTERGVYVSLDDGGSWEPLQLDLPVVPVTDLAVKEGDLVAATQGRGYWILDDLSPLRQLDPAAHGDGVHLFAPRPALRVAMGRAEEPGAAGTNPHPGAVIDYLLPAERDPETPVRLEIQEADGTPVRTFLPEPTEGEKPEPLPKHLTDDPRGLPVEPGFNRFAWDLRYPGAESYDGRVYWNRSLAGPRAVPGTYRAVLTVGDETRAAAFEVRPDPRTSATVADMRAQFDFLVGVRDTLSRVHAAVRRLRDVRDQLKAIEERYPEGAAHHDVAIAAAALAEKLTAVEEALLQTKSKSPQDPLNFPIRLGDKLAGVRAAAATGDHAPTAQAVAVARELTAAIEAELAKLDALHADDLPRFEQLAADLPAIRPPAPEADL